MSNPLTIFSITNGRSTHAYSLRALCESIGINSPIVVLRDMNWLDALNYCVEICDTPLFLRVDDDMIVHPRAVAYMLDRSSQEKEFGLVYFHLWEDYTQRVRESIKVYSRDALRAIGGFASDPKTGRVDRSTNGVLERAGYPIVKDASIVALHVCGTWEEQEKYELLWNGMATTSYHKPNRQAVKAYCGTKTLEDQAALRRAFLVDLNWERKSGFAKWLKHCMNPVEDSTVSTHKTICEVHKSIADLLIIHLNNKPKALAEILQHLESAYRSGICMSKALIDHKLDLPEWEKNNMERAKALRKERVRLLDELRKEGHILT